MTPAKPKVHKYDRYASTGHLCETDTYVLTEIGTCCSKLWRLVTCEKCLRIGGKKVKKK